MPIITEVHSICAAPGWGVESLSGDPAKTEPTACFALVSTVEPGYPGAGTAREVIALPASMLFTDLIGKNTADFPMVSPR